MNRFSLHNRFSKIILIAFSLHFCIWSLLPASPASKKQEPGLLFYLSGDQGFKADFAANGMPEPNYLANVKLIPDGAKGPGFECGDDQLMSYWAPGNIYAERGTLSFFWRSREPVGKTEFPIFRVGFADHSSWDMVWLRIDYNGKGFDAFVTDANLARVRVSYTLSPFPKPNQWIHLALSWDETSGIRFYVNGKLAAKKDSVVVLYTGLDQFGPHSRIISPMQVQSAYNFQRGGDIDEIRIYDRMLSNGNIARLAKGEPAGEVPKLMRTLHNSKWQAEWRLRYGWNREGDVPVYLEQPATRVRKVEIGDVYDLKRWWWKSTDGIRETTWPGVYNRSRLPGRNDYFQLPDWDCYSLSGKSVTFFMPDETWNHLEISGAAYGKMSLVTTDKSGNILHEKELFQRPQGQEKTFHTVEPIRGQEIRFDNVEQEMPIGELSAYNVEAGKEPSGICTLSYSLTSNASTGDVQFQPLLKFINGRYMPDERSVMVAMPNGISQSTKGNGFITSLPLVHVLIPHDARSEFGAASDLDSAYTWDKINGGLDGIAIDLPALKLKPANGNLIPINIQIKDPIWPMRNMLDFSFSVKPNESRTLWLDTRDRILPSGKSLYLTIASAEKDFSVKTLEGARIRLIFKPWKEAYREHVQDRFTQVRDNIAHIIEEHPNDTRLNLYNRLVVDITDLLRIDPKHYPGQNYAYEYGLDSTKPPFIQPICPEGVPLWAFRQIEDLRYFKRFVLWWIDNRQISNGELGGGLSDDDDQTNCWPGAALMGCEPKKIGGAILRMLDAIYEQGMFTNGLATIQTDGLHAHEDGIEAQTQAMLVDYGSPKQLERIMETVRALDERIMLKNKAGHRHFRSSYFSGTKIADESVWEWALQPQQFLLLEPVLTLATYNGNLRARQLAIDMADGLLAHARKDEKGKIVFDTEINFSSDSARPSPLGSKGMLAASMGNGATFSTSSAGLQLLWAVYRLTGDQKYIQPLLGFGEEILGTISNNALDILNVRSTFGKKILAKTTPINRNDFFRHVAWQMTGDKTYLENYYADQIESSVLREYINTEGSLWTDRVFAANRELQRSRLGGIALVRGMIYPGQVVSWKFNAPATEESAAILIPESTPSAIKIVAYAIDNKPVETTMTAWDVEPGKWEVTQGFDINGDEKADTIFSTQVVDLERSKNIQLTFAPHKTTIIMLKLQSKSVPYWQRPDLGIGKEDITVQGNTIKVKVHNLGSVDAPAVMLAVMQNDKSISAVQIPAIQAPVDLLPKYAEVLLTIPPTTDLHKCSIQIDPEKKLNEITLMNNRIDLNESVFMVNSTNQKSKDQIVLLKQKPRLEYIAFNVTDPAAIAQWYCDHLGMKIVRKSLPPANTHFIGDTAGNMTFELYNNPSVPVPEYRKLSHLALHLAFMVDDVKSMRDSILAAGATLVEDVVTTPAGDQVLMMRDPWGLAMQFVKRKSPMLTPAGIRPEHFALNVTDPQSMTNWYFENLGMKVMRKGTPPTYTNFFADAGSNMMMEVFNNSEYPVLDMWKMNHLSIHIAFMVDDIRAIRNGLIAAGATLVEDVKVSSGGDQILMLRNPWGVPIQFIQRGEPVLQ
jgi:catechol 2,3-dioxygenase-like lactoylglutathione lyase family enzyme